MLSFAYALGVVLYALSSPDLGLRCAFNPTIIAVDALSLHVQGNTPGRGDTLVQVGTYPIQTSPQLWSQVLLIRALRREDNPDFVRTVDGQKEILVQFRSHEDGQLRSAWCQVGTLRPQELIPSILWLFLKLGLFGIGALVFWKRPADPSAAQFFLLCIVTLGAYMGGYHWARIVIQPVLLVVFMVCSVLLPAVSLHFYLVFPRPKRFLVSRVGWTLTVIYGPPLGFLLALLLGYRRVKLLFMDGSWEAIAAAWELLRLEILLYLAVAALWYVASVICLIHSYRVAHKVTERNQVKWITFGSVIALVPIGYTLFLIRWHPDDFGSGAATWPMFAASVCFTVAFAVSITRYRLMQLDQIISSGVVYFLISFLAGLVYYAVVFIGMLLSGVIAGPPSIPQALSVSTTALVLMVVLDLARSRFKKALDRRFDRDKHQLDRTLRRMGQAIEQLVDPPTLARRLLQASAELLNVPRGAVYLREGEPPLFCLAGCLGPAPPLLELSSGCPLVEALQTSGKVVIRPGIAGGTDPAQRQLQLVGGAVAHALAHEGELLALLILGPKETGSYTHEDLNLLAAFAQLTALALESAERRQAIEGLNLDLGSKVEKISEQQRRILALQSQLMRQRSAPVEAPAAEAKTASGILGSGPAVRQLLELVRKVSASQSAVLIRGESGTGKGLLARALHDSSPRSDKPFVKVHCAALSPGLLESELFGHVKGAFTSAHRDKVGRFELAHGGTLFLDEIGDITLDVQTKLLRVLEEKTFERVGSSEPVQVDVHIIAATHQNLEELIRQGRFRGDLYYRLNVIDIPVPPLRERREDIAELTMHFLEVYAQRCGRGVTQIDDDALAQLKAYHWPGNIRELEHVIERAVVVTEGPLITIQDLPLEVAHADLTADDGEPAGKWDEDSASEALTAGGVQAERAERGRRERERLVRALAAARGNKAEAARLLGLARSTLISRLKKHGLS